MNEEKDKQLETLIINEREVSSEVNEKLMRIKEWKIYRVYIYVILIVISILVFCFFINKLAYEEKNEVLNNEEIILLKKLIQYYKNEDDVVSADNNMHSKTDQGKRKEEREENKAIIKKELLKIFENEYISMNEKKLPNIIDQLLSYDKVTKKQNEHVLLNGIGKNEEANEETNEEMKENKKTDNNKWDELKNIETKLNNLRYISLFQEFVEKYNKTYKHIPEKVKRYDNFKKNYTEIEAHNKTNSSYKKQINYFSDYSEEELNRRFKKLMKVPQHLIIKHTISLEEAIKKNVPPKENEMQQFFYQTHKIYKYDKAIAEDKEKKKERERNIEKDGEEEKNKDVKTYPPNLDFRAQGIVTEVRDQGNCGSCYIFSAVGNIESIYIKRFKKLLNFSDQEVLDCSEYCLGCDGGHPFYTFLYVQQNGICLYDDYKYIAKENLFCLTYKCSEKVWLRSIGYVEENQIIKALNIIGPITVNIGVTPDFVFYKSGIYNGPCAADINHSVLLIGYGEEKKNNKKYNNKNKSFYEIETEEKQRERLNLIGNTFEKNEHSGQLNYDHENTEEGINVHINGHVMETDDNDNDDDDTIYYWIIKNSWGRNWGENGFIRIKRSKEGTDQFCGIGKEVFFPIL